jgi:hypothetical protein
MFPGFGNRKRHPQRSHRYSSGIFNCFPPLFPAIGILRAELVYDAAAPVLAIVERMRAGILLDVHILFILFTAYFDRHQQTGSRRTA